MRAACRVRTACQARQPGRKKGVCGPGRLAGEARHRDLRRGLARGRARLVESTNRELDDSGSCLLSGELGWLRSEWAGWRPPPASGCRVRVKPASTVPRPGRGCCSREPMNEAAASLPSCAVWPCLSDCCGHAENEPDRVCRRLDTGAALPSLFDQHIAGGDILWNQMDETLAG
jgi:hypothetical protein